MLTDYTFPSLDERVKLKEKKINQVSIETKLSPEIITGKEILPVSKYQPTEEESMIRSMVVKHFTLGDLTMRKPRREFNDMALVTRTQIDRMAFNSYQPNDGDPLDGNETTAWKSNAMRPITRNKVISIAAHATARIVFPKIFAYNDQAEEQRDAAQVMEDLMEWSGEQSSYSKTALYATIQALVEPAAIVYTDYSEVYRQVKTEKDEKTGKWNIKEVLDETLSGFGETLVPVEELYIENAYEHDIQKQGWLIWRKVISYSLAEAKYKHFDNFQFVRPGVQIIFDDANRQFYEVYDSSMRQYDVEEVTYWNRTLDLKIIMVNGVLLTPADNPNPRQDKKYPFAKFGYELIDSGRFFYYKSLAFKMGQDAKVINTLYQMVIDGTYLRLFPPMVNMGPDVIGADVLIPGAITTISQGSDMKPLTTQNDIGSGMNAMFQVEKSISDTSMDEWMMGSNVTKRQTAYSMSIMQQNANLLLGLFIQMISSFVRDFGHLRLSDILQYMTIADVQKIEGDAPLVFKTFLLQNKQSGGKNITRKIQFDNSLPVEPISEEDKMHLSYENVSMQGGSKAHTELYRVNPELFRCLKFMCSINPDVLNPISEEMEKQFGLEAFDKSINAVGAGVPVDMEVAYREFVLRNFPQSKRNPDKFIKKPQAGGPGMPGMPNMPGSMGLPGKSGAPIGLPQKPSTATI